MRHGALQADHVLPLWARVGSSANPYWTPPSFLVAGSACSTWSATCTALPKLVRTSQSRPASPEP